MHNPDNKGFTITGATSDIAVITLNDVSEPGQHLDWFKAVIADINAADADPAVRGIVLACNRLEFPIEANAADFGAHKEILTKLLQTASARLDACAKPTVAAIAGAAIGGGLELVLACHARVAVDSAKLGFPAIGLGLIPGSGGTQRLPRVTTPQVALSLMQSGTLRTAADLRGSGILDAVATEDVVDAATHMASTLAKELVLDGMLPRARDKTVDRDETQTLVAKEREKLTIRQRLQPAYGALLDALDATTLPFDVGLQIEQTQLQALLGSAASQALRYQLGAERAASMLPEELKVKPREFSTVAVIGAGTMGAGIAMCCLDAGLDVLMLEQDHDALQRGRQRVTDHYSGRVKAGKQSAISVTELEARLSLTIDWSTLKRADVIIEAVFEDAAVKQTVFKRIDQFARPGAVLATNTSYLDVDAIARATARPAEVLGLHFFSPANVMKLVEVVRGKDTGADVLATGMALARQLKKQPVLTGNAFGFIGNRVYNAYRKQCEFMLEDGAWPEDVDTALTEMGFAMGPFAVADLSGLDIAWRMRKAQASSRDSRERYVAILDQLCELGRLGRKTALGYYAYTDGRQAKGSDAVVRKIVEGASSQKGITRRALGATAIRRRALLAMVNEAALLLAEGVAVRPSDIDVVLIQGYGFPRWEGGPVFWAAHQERAQLDSDLAQMIAENGFGYMGATADMLDRLLA